MDWIQIGSQTAKDGFKNEDDIIEKFNHWQRDNEAQQWLIFMQYPIADIESIKAIKIIGYKTDVQVQVIIQLK